jgi:benzil reductase ((S)-benzoin forming)
VAEASFHRELAGFPGSRVVFIHAAGAIGPIGFAGETDPREYRASVLLNAAAPLILGDAFLRAGRHLSCRRQLVLLSSGAAQRPYPGVAAYGAAKAAVDQWVRATGNEQARRGNVQVIAVTPGRVATTMHAQLRAAPDDQLPDRPEFIRLHEEGLLSNPAKSPGSSGHCSMTQTSDPGRSWTCRTIPPHGHNPRIRSRRTEAPWARQERPAPRIRPER